MEKFEKLFLGKYPRRGAILSYMREALQKDEVEWSDLTTVNLMKVADVIRDNVTPNTASVYFAILSGFLGLFEDESIIPSEKFRKVLKSKKTPSQHIALTMDELLRVDAYQPESEAEQDIKTLFMRGCLTGARSSDAELLSSSNIADDMLSYVSIKTKIEVVQPAHKMLHKYLSRRAKAHSKRVQSYLVRKIAKVCGIDDEVQLFVNGKLKKGPKWQFVTMHTSRRTYCTLLAELGTPVEMISKLAGHSNSTITSKTYICLDTKKVGSAAMKFFNMK